MPCKLTHLMVTLPGPMLVSVYQGAKMGVWIDMAKGALKTMMRSMLDLCD